ncbi:MAG: hypothetical protein ACKO3T_25375, partial [Planctomycetaceae bacterium]
MSNFAIGLCNPSRGHRIRGADTLSTGPTGNGPLSTTQDHFANDVEEVLPTASVQNSHDKLTPVQY